MSNNIFFHYTCPFQLKEEGKLTLWLKQTAQLEKKPVNELHFIFCDDNYLINKNQQYLNHDTYTDIITFDYTENEGLCGDIFISVERVKENAITFAVPFDEEIRRVMIHGVLHLIGYNDKSDKEKEMMTKKENQYLTLFC